MIKAILGVVVMGLLAGCAASDRTNSDESNIVVGITDVHDRVTVEDDRLTFDAVIADKLTDQLARIDGKKEPVYLIGDRQSDARKANGALKEKLRNPLGYLRRGVSWSKAANGDIVIMTERATLAEAQKELDSGNVAGLNTRLPGRSSIAPQDVNSNMPNTNGAERKWHYAFGEGGDGYQPFDLAGKVLWQHDLLAGGQATLKLSKGRLNIRPVIDASLATDSYIPQSGSVRFTTDVDGEVELTAEATGTFEVHEGQQIYHEDFGGVMPDSLGIAAGLPLTMSVDVSWKCDLGSSGKATASYGATAKGHLEAGASFEGLSLATDFPPPSLTFGQIDPRVDSNVNVVGGCHLVTSLALHIFDAAGPTSSLDLYTKLDVKGAQANLGARVEGALTYGYEAKFGGELKPFGYQIASITADPLKWEQDIPISLTLGR